ncbi:MAG: SpoIIE family protein phosphatase [Polyangiaceae bacterium]
MTLVAENSNLSDFPVRHGSLCVSGATLSSAVPSVAFEAVVDSASELSVAVLDVRGGHRDLRSDLMSTTRNALQRRAPMYEIVSALRSFSASERSLHVGVVLLRFSQPESRVEILNAGMPAAACVLPDGELSLHAALSSAIGERFGEVHPYELAPLSWGSSWLLSSDGFTHGRKLPEQVKNLLCERELPQRAAELAEQSPEKLAKIVAATQTEGDPARRDVSLLAVHADPTRRFRSGIRR